MNLGPYAHFIVACYGLVAAVVAILIGWIAVDHFRVKAQLRDLEASGVSRRSGRNATDLS